MEAILMHILSLSHSHRNLIIKMSYDIVFHSIGIKVQKGSLVAIVGTVGSGKSSILSAILGEMHKTRGTIQVQVIRMQSSYNSIVSLFICSVLFYSLLSYDCMFGHKPALLLGIDVFLIC